MRTKTKQTHNPSETTKVVLENPDVRVVRKVEDGVLLDYSQSRLSDNFRDFKEIVHSMAGYLEELQSACSKVTKKNTKQFVDEISINAFPIIDMYFIKIWNAYCRADMSERKGYQEFSQKVLLPYFLVSPYTKRIYEKPLGYAGDYKMMIYIYENGYEGSSAYSKLIHRYSLYLPVSKANFNRRFYFMDKINQIVVKQDISKIASIACGPAVEVTDYLISRPIDCNRCQITCMDSEPKALRYIKNKISRIEKEAGKKLNNITLTKNNIVDLLFSKKMDKLLDKQDLIYSAGLIDYFDDKVAAKFIETMYDKLNHGGQLIIGNVSSEYAHRAYTELLGEWYLNCRNEENLLSLASNIREFEKVCVEYEPLTKMNLFLNVYKK